MRSVTYNIRNDIFWVQNQHLTKSVTTFRIGCQKTGANRC